VLLLYLAYRLGSYWMGENYSMQILGATVSILALYCCALHLNLKTWLARQMIIFGKYSLLGYLAQIAILQIIVHLAHRQPSHRSTVAGVGVVTIVLTFGIVRTVHELRQKSRAVDVTYKAIFA
jgi:hypothetical protein